MFVSPFQRNIDRQGSGGELGSALDTDMDWYPSVINSTEYEYYELFEKCGLWVRISEHVVHDMNFKALTDDTHI